ncbi:SMP-30/gluconolactonase/LRE family protein [Methylorubrum extorquens]|jgi:sugar lactone lactonase YvrE|uniref:SMP-30/gluconolactonase/LRE family protein n=1 Tax=Methylorubrum extorquens TaxID=408 RepID=UPI002238EF86|nr:SMP-30/gluconolactonase/LRE family protein [Methylorubrum extorquens]UYW26357.1 SMP-30/gluconolactonase/LRE family protein [Methylorubrum extorquens]UYW33901.1 SMP-30/gluconolactonase/LRE family protein [Methylorubrum extorquens]
MTPPVHPHTPRVAVACGCTLGEEVVWDARDESLLWVDIENPAIWRHWPATGETVRLPLDEKIGFAVLTPDPDRVVAGFKSGVAALRLSDGSRTPLVRPDNYPAGNRLNSGNAGPDGWLYFGSMDDAEEAETGGFHRWDGARVETFGSRAAVTNGPVVSPDGRRVYTIDTANGIVQVHALNDGRIGEARPLIRFEEGWGKPDGLTLDAEHHLWICHYGAGRITRFDPDGHVAYVVPMPTPLVTKCAFGGDDLSTLYVTTCLRGRDPTLEPMAGHLYKVETGFRGFPANLLALPQT